MTPSASASPHTNAGEDVTEDLSLYTSDWYLVHAIPEGLRQTVMVASAVLEETRPDSVVDVGCGIGTFLKCAGDAGARELLGIEGPHVDGLRGWRNSLSVSRDNVLLMDLQEIENARVQDKRLLRRYDLAICLEVAEHLPPRVGPSLVDLLVDLSGVVVFSGATPGQEGNILEASHINERPKAYWQGQFAERGYTFDELATERIVSRFRGRIPSVAWYENLRVYRERKA